MYKTLKVIGLALLAFVINFTISSCEDESIKNEGEKISSVNSKSKIIDEGGQSACPDSHPYQACGKCWADAQQAISGGCNDNPKDKTEVEESKETVKTENNCPKSHPYQACGQCWADAEQAKSSGCDDTIKEEQEEKPTEDNTSTDNTPNLNCPQSHPYQACGQCWADAEQAKSSGCTENGQTTPENNKEENQEENTETHNTDKTIGEGTPCGKFNYNPKNLACVTPVGNGNDGCLNSDGLFVSVKKVVSNPCNTKEAILDIERNLNIDIDDDFIENHCGYQGPPPSINPKITLKDAKTYFVALFGRKVGNEFGDLLDTNKDGWLNRNEATMAKGQDPRQLLNLPVKTGLGTDDVLAYLGLYLGDGALDKYAGDLGDDVMGRLQSFTRTWQPGSNASSERYDPNNVLP